MDNRIKIGVSACLLGQPVRFDGSHQHDRYLTGTPGEYLDFVPVCPEVETGFPIPRKSFRLVGDPENPHFMTTRSQVDYTERMTAWAERRVRELEKENLYHIMGFFKRQLSAEEKQELLEVLDQCGRGHLPLIVPITLLNHYVRKYYPHHLQQQTYLNPQPVALKSRNHA
jgi:uncharacterized protein YbgA (DUF1722 family)